MRNPEEILAGGQSVILVVHRGGLDKGGRIGEGGQIVASRIQEPGRMHVRDQMRGTRLHRRYRQVVVVVVVVRRFVVADQALDRERSLGTDAGRLGLRLYRLHRGQVLAGWWAHV